jgi:hypothetical protein
MRGAARVNKRANEDLLFLVFLYTLHFLKNKIEVLLLVKQ